MFSHDWNERLVEHIVHDAEDGHPDGLEAFAEMMHVQRQPEETDAAFGHDLLEVLDR